MKNLTIFLSAAIAGLLMSVNSYGEDKKDIAGTIDKKEYIIEVNMAQPFSGRTVPLSPHYSVKVKKDSVYSNLPYYGRAYSLPYGGGAGLTFEGVSEDYVVKEGKKKSTEISFSVRTREDNFVFHISVYPEGQSYISVLSNNRQPISFNGYLYPLNPDIPSKTETR